MSNAVGQEPGTYATVNEEEEENKWILNNLRRRVCTTYIQIDQSETCECGYTRQEHEQPISLKSDTKWNSDKHTKCVQTNAFGEISFVGHGASKSKYVRVEKDTDMKDMMKLMTKFWRLKKPKLLISVTGGAKRFKMSKLVTERFQRGLIKAARSTGAWIITGGSDAGVMQHVGEAIKKHGGSSAKAAPVIAIGIAVWGCVQGNTNLIRQDEDNNEVRWQARYQIDAKANKNETFLNPNHSHFILVDDGRCRKFGKEIKFRASLQSEIVNYKELSWRGTDDVPVVMLVLEGGEYTLNTVKESIKYDIPVVIIEGSGRIADILAYAYKNTKAKTSENEDGSTRKKIPKAVKKTIMKKLQSERITKTERLNDVVYIIEEKPDLLTVFRLSSYENTTQDIDVAILKSLLEANKDNEFNQLKLALTWNRIDMAKTMNGNKLKTKELEYLLQRAIEENRVDFTEMFLDQVASMQDFLTEERLLEIYKHTITTQSKSQVEANDGEEIQKLSLKEIGKELEKLIGTYYISKYSDDSDDTTSIFCIQGEQQKTFKNPYQHLFIWSILKNRMDMAKFFWEQGKEKIPAAVVGSAIMNALAEESNDSKQSKDMKENSKFFSSLAIDSLNACHEADKRKTSDLLVRQNDQWGFTTCIKLAVESNNKHFIASPVCYSLLQHVWYGGLATENGTIKILLCMVFFVFIPFLKFRSDEETESDGFVEAKSSKVNNQHNKEKGGVNKGKPEKQSSYETESNIICRFLRKCLVFYSAPIVKFLLNVVSYMVFLGYFSYVMLVQFDNEVTNDEMILGVWMFSVFVDEIYQYIQTTRRETHMRKVKHDRTLPSMDQMTKQVQKIWLITDIVAIGLLVVGIVLRVTAFEYSRVCFGVTLIVFFFRSLNIFSAHRRLGPKIVMIGKMFNDLLYFLIILMVFVTSYAIAAYSILYPNSILNGNLLMKVLRVAYWNLYGELFVDEIERQEPECTFNPNLYKNGTLPRCPTVVGSYVVPVLMGIYVMFSNILLLNLLIAMFSNTVNRIEAKSDLHWHFQRYFLICRYETRSPFPQPFALVFYIYVLIRFIFRRCIKRCKRTSQSLLYKQVANAAELVQWENEIVNANLFEKKEAEMESIEHKIKTIHESLETVSSMVRDVHEMSTERLRGLENDVKTRTNMIKKHRKENPVGEQPDQAEANGVKSDPDETVDPNIKHEVNISSV